MPTHLIPFKFLFILNLLIDMFLNHHIHKEFVGLIDFHGTLGPPNLLLRSGFVVTSLEKFVFASHLRKPKIRNKARDFPKPITSKMLLTYYPRFSLTLYWCRAS